jgi:flavin-dependent dehydrogenase
MARLGHDVCLVERSRFPRIHLGESLSPGVLPLLETTGSREAIEAGGFRPVRRVHVNWDAGPQIREDPREECLLVDRGEFDLMLLENAGKAGVRVLQPARVLEYDWIDGEWMITVVSDGRISQLRSRFLADASGRGSGIGASDRESGSVSRKKRAAPRTVALYGYWRGEAIPEEPRIEAGDDAWYWGVPLPDGTYNTLVFVDANHFRAAPAASLYTRFLELLDRSSLLSGCHGHHLVHSVRTVDATPYLDDQAVAPSWIRIGDAALAVDPISSSGVQKAIQSALSAAIVANTLLRRPASADAATSFYRNSLAEASGRHCRWAAGHYGSVAVQRGGRFWQDRAVQPDAGVAAASASSASANVSPMARVSLSTQAEFVELPCIENDFVVMKRALRHPNLETPIAWLGGRELAPLLQQLPAGSTPVQLAQFWSDRIPLKSGLAIAGWLLNRGILVEEGRLARKPVA